MYIDILLSKQGTPTLVVVNDHAVGPGPWYPIGMLQCWDVELHPIGEGDPATTEATPCWPPDLVAWHCGHCFGHCGIWFLKRGAETMSQLRPSFENRTP